ncbi:hypothetical protein D9M71_630870 [compost metagenome]
MSSKSAYSRIASASPTWPPQGLWIISMALAGMLISSPAIATTLAIDAARPSMYTTTRAEWPRSRLYMVVPSNTSPPGE